MQQDHQALQWAADLGKDWSLIESLLPQDWQSKARELGTFRRCGAIANARALLQVLLIHLGQGCSLRETAVQARLAGIAHLSDVALLKRLRSCSGWFEWLGQQLRQAPELRCGTSASQSPLLAGRRLYAVDGSVISEPGATGSQWRLHYAIALPDLRCQQVHLGSSSQGESFKRFAVRPGDILMADRGYAHPGGIAHVRAQGGDAIVRLNLLTLPLYEPTGSAGVLQRLDILEKARTLKAGQAGSWPAWVHPKSGKGAKQAAEPGAEHNAETGAIEGQLCIIGKSGPAAAKARARVRRESQRGGTQVQAQTLGAADYVFVFTTLQDIQAEQVLELYRLRWQVELEFKRLKSLLGLGHLKKHDAQAACSWLQGKLLVALLIARLIAHAERVSPWGYEIARVQQATRALSVAGDGVDARVAVPGSDAADGVVRDPAMLERGAKAVG